MKSKMRTNKCKNCGRIYPVTWKNVKTKYCGRECFKLGVRGENNPCWRGDSVTYAGIHRWTKKNLERPTLCNFCLENKSLDLANLSGKYKRDLADWIWLCRRCHFQFDKERDHPTDMKTGKFVRGV